MIYIKQQKSRVPIKGLKIRMICQPQRKACSESNYPTNSIHTLDNERNKNEK